MSQRKHSLFTPVMAMLITLCASLNIPACIEINDETVTQAISATIVDEVYYHGFIEEISSEICDAGIKIDTSALDCQGYIWAMSNDIKNKEYTLVKYDTESNTAHQIHSFPAKSNELPTMLSVSPCVVHSPSEGLVYIFGEGKNMQIIDLSSQNVQAPLFCDSPQTLFWTDSKSNQVFRLSISSGTCEPIFEELLEYSTIETLSSTGNNILLRANTLKTLQFTALIASAEGKVIQHSVCPDCIYGTLGFKDAQIHITETSASIIYANTEYPLGLKAAPKSAVFTDDGLLAVLCSDDDKNYQLLLYDLIDNKPAYVGSDIQNFDEIISFNLAGAAYDKDRYITVLLTDAKRENKLYLWHIPHSEPVILMGTQKEEEAVSAFCDSISDKVASIENKYNIRVLYGDEAVLAFPDYTAEPVYDKTLIRTALEKIDIALSRYPDGYFEYISDGVTRGILFCLTGAMYPKNDINIANPEAFAVIYCNTQIIALNIAADNDLERTIYHEITHATDKKIAAGASDGSISFSEDVWNTLNPNGFEYFNAYLDQNGNSYSYTGGLQWTAFDCNNATEDIYFVDSYSKTFASEDRARLMETVMSSTTLPEFINSKNIQAKLSYYFAAIRQIQGINSSETLYWERALLMPAEYATGQ